VKSVQNIIFQPRRANPSPPGYDIDGLMLNFWTRRLSDSNIKVEYSARNRFRTVPATLHRRLRSADDSSGIIFTQMLFSILKKKIETYLYIAK
jgi:hypothetical protein